MSPQRPTRGPAKRISPPKRPIEHLSAVIPNATDASDGAESATDLSALVNILEAAMSEDGPHRRRDDAQPVFGPRRLDVFTAAGLSRPETPGIEPGEVTRPKEGATPREGAAFDEVARSLAAAESCVPLLAQSTGLMRLAALDVVKAETTRAGGLLQLLRFLRGDLNPGRSAISSSALIQRLVQAVDSERRVRGVSLTTRSSVPEVTLAGDETLLGNTLLALLVTTFALVEGVPNARVTVSVTMNDDGEIGVAISQDHVPAPATWTARMATDESAADPATIVQEIAMSAAHRLTREWAGRFAIAGGERSSILTIWLPALPPGTADPPH